MTEIEWADTTWNPLNGCTKVSPGCDNCYMYQWYPRLKAKGATGYDKSPNIVNVVPERLHQPLTWKRPKAIFVASMSDLFHAQVPTDYLISIFDVMYEAAEQHGHIFQVLTKRPGRAAHFWKVNAPRYDHRWHPSIWLGTSVEQQKYAPRLTVLSRIPAPTRFCSAEPLLEHLDLTPWLQDGTLQWLIVGGESGRGARPMNPDWARALRDQAEDNQVPFFLKQLGGATSRRGRSTATLDGIKHHEFPPPLDRPARTPHPGLTLPRAQPAPAPLGAAP